MSEVKYHKEGVIASYPYTFDIDENDTGIILAYVYDHLQVNQEEKEKIQTSLSALETQENSGYLLMDDKVVYRSIGNVKDYKDIGHAEVGIRRHFIEDFIETDEDLKKIVSPYHAHTLKTEFVID